MLCLATKAELKIPDEPPVRKGNERGVHATASSEPEPACREYWLVMSPGFKQEHSQAHYSCVDSFVPSNTCTPWLPWGYEMGQTVAIPSSGSLEEAKIPR